MTGSKSVETRVLVQEGRQQPRREIGVVALVEETAPRVGIKAAHAFAEAGMHVHAFGGQRGQTKKNKG